MVLFLTDELQDAFRRRGLQE